MKRNLLFLAGCWLMLSNSSCSKSSEGSRIQEQNANEFKSVLLQHRFRLSQFYSDRPIDYIGDDSEVRQETDLNKYIRPYLVDDENLFDSSGIAFITQGTIKFPGDGSPVISRSFKVHFDSDNAYLDFLDYDYVPVTYKLASSNASSFTIYLDWHTGAKVYSVFTRID